MSENRSKSPRGARFAHMCGPGERRRRPESAEFSKTYPGAILLGPRIIAIDSPRGHYPKSRCANFLIWTRSWRTLSFAAIRPSLCCHRQNNWPLIDELSSPDAAPLCRKIGRGARQSRTPRSQTIGLTESEVLLGTARVGHVERVVECSLQHSAEAFLRQMVHAG